MRRGRSHSSSLSRSSGSFLARASATGSVPFDPEPTSISFPSVVSSRNRSTPSSGPGPRRRTAATGTGRVTVEATPAQARARRHCPASGPLGQCQTLTLVQLEVEVEDGLLRHVKAYGLRLRRQLLVRPEIQHKKPSFHYNLCQ
eukprot:2530536-Rhodomonas_salina.2